MVCRKKRLAMPWDQAIDAAIFVLPLGKRTCSRDGSVTGLFDLLLNFAACCVNHERIESRHRVTCVEVNVEFFRRFGRKVHRGVKLPGSNKAFELMLQGDGSSLLP